MKTKNHPLFIALVCSIASVAAGSAAPLYWKTSVAAAWDSAAWATAPGGTYDQAWVPGSNVVFEENLGTTLTIAGPVATTNFTSITANENVTVTPNNTLGTGGTVAIVEVAADKTLNFAGQALSTAAGTGFIKNGPGTWSLANGNTYAGGFTLNTGTVAVGGVNALGDGGTLTLNGGTLRSTGTNARDLTGKYDLGITLGGDITLGDTISTGLLTFSNNTDLGAATRTLTVNSAVTHTGAITGGVAAGLTKAGSGTLTLSGANTYSGPTTVNNGMLEITAIGALPGYSTNGSFSVASGATLAVTNAITDANITSILGTTNFSAGSAIGFDTTAGARAYAVVLADTVGGTRSLGLVKIGANTLTLSNANTYSGGTLVDGGGGTLAVSHASALGTGPVLVNGTTAGQGTLSVGASLTVNRPLTLKRGSGSRAYLSLGGGSTWSGDITVDNTNAVNNNFAAILATGTTLATAGTVSGNIGYSVLGGAGSATSQSLVLRNTNGYGKVSGSVSLSNGWVQLLDSSKWEFSNASNTWGTLDINHASAIVTVGATNTLSSTGAVYSSVAGTLQMNNQAGTTAYSQSIAGLSGNVKVGLLTGAATLTLNTTADQSGSGIISGAISLVKSGSAKQTLTGVNTYTGSNTINGGTLALGTTGVMSQGDLTISSATLDLRKGTATRAQTVNNLSLSDATLEIGLNASPDSITVNGTATVSGSNTLKLHGSVPAGTYNLISTSSPLPDNFSVDTSDVTVSGFTGSYTAAIDGNNYVLTVGGTATPYTAYWHGDVSSVWDDATAAPNSNWATDSTGATDTAQIAGAITDVYFSTATATNTDTTLGADTSINSLTFESGTATVGGFNTLTVLATSGNGIDVLSGANATLNIGSIVCTATTAVQAGGILNFNGGGFGAGPLLVDGTFNLNANLTLNALQGANTGVLTRGIAGTGILTVSGTSNATSAVAINDSVGTVVLVKAGTSALTLSGNSNFSGGTTVTTGEGALVADHPSALGTGPVLVNGQTTFANSLQVNAGLAITNAVTLKRGQGGGNRATMWLGAGADWQGAITLDNSGANGFAVISAGGGTAATACIVSGNIGFSTLGTPTSSAPTLALRSSNNFGKVTGSISLSTGYVQLLDPSKWEFSKVSNTWGTLDIAHAGAIATVGTANTLSPSGIVMSTVAGTLQLNNQDGTTAYDQSIAGLSGNVKVGLVTGAATLTVNTTADQSSAGAISGAISLIKTGAAVQSLTGINTYTGNTTVNAGTLVLADNAQLTFAIGATSGTNNSMSGAGTVTLDGDFNIDTSLADASALASGTWTLESVASLTGAYGSTFQVVSGATAWTATDDVWTTTVGGKNYSFDEATGVLTMTSNGGFDSWAASKGLTGADAAFDADPDHDGLDNGLEFVLGGEPNPANPGANSADLLPKVSQSAGNMSFTFKRKDISESGVALTFQWSTDLTFPSPANDIPIGAVDSTTDTIAVDVTEDIPDAATDTVVITVPAAKAAGGKLFGRLNAVKVP